MIRRSAPWFGVLLLVFTVALLVGFGRTVLVDPVTAALLVGFACAGLLSIVGGTRESVTIGSRTIPRNVFLGASSVVLAVGIAPSGIRVIGTGGTAPVVAGAGLLVSSVSLAWLGVQTARDSRHVELEDTPSTKRIVTVAALVAVSFGFGAVLVSYV
ncbi:hypothetical protein [Natronobacterium texcoconense]|uniref:Uncharacterized protein n=1 Tax=Natronobacterium texcoconense TaxID=1095778 RepID=A0A1H1IQE2_NATTX|nr:hypothetical protein [Natronobacterium texcoconense]SDR39907.1 hypothetical protein SAMN04489842_3721 [Natronobacterium texcoconense]